MARRSLLAMALGVGSWVLSGCSIPGVGAERNTEKWLRSRPWVAEVEKITALGGPVPLPQPMNVSATVRAVPGTDWAAVQRIRTEIEAYAAEATRDVSSLQVQLGFDSGALPISGKPTNNTDLFALFDSLFTERRTQRVEFERATESRLRVMMAGDGDGMFTYAGWAATHDPGEAAILTVSDMTQTRTVRTRFERNSTQLNTLGRQVAAARALSELRGFAADATTSPSSLTIELTSRDQVEAVFRTMHSTDPGSTDLTVMADRVGIRGPTAAADRYPAARAVVEAEASIDRLIVQDNAAAPGRVTLDARIGEKERVGAAAAAIGAHPESAGDGLVWLVLNPIARVRMAGTPEEIAACGGPAQAVMSTTGRDASVDSMGRKLRLAHGLGTTGLTDLCRSMRANGWDGDLDFVISGGLYRVSYRSTATGRARDIEIGRSDGTTNGAQLWLDAWNSTATE
ncbi:hypothetical protein AADG42_05455 [Ammonicoccus fulvus]|uniref:Uncharacterized protein n=1 Tax=Ammonicoccus fulvus TaxID=3138240 RepID=A0ABZ3FMX8_9ACTN